MLRATSAGSTLVNDTLLQWTNHHLPLGGIGPSGQGGYHGVHGSSTAWRKSNCRALRMRA